MHTFNIVFQSVLALLGIGFLGFWIARRGMIPENILGVLSRLAIDIGLPAIVFANILVQFSPSKFPDWWHLPLWWIFFTVIALLLSLLATFISQKSTRGEFALSLFFLNAIFFPLIIITGLFGTASPYISQLFIFVFLHPPMFFSTYFLFFRTKTDGQKRQFQLARILNPVLFATIIAVALQLFNIRSLLPDFVLTIFQILGGMSLPLIMIILGGSLYLDFKKKGEIFWQEIIKFVIVKNIVFPLVFLGILILLKPSNTIAFMIILQSVVPPITAIPIATEREGGNRAITNQFILASFLASIVTIPLIFALYNIFFSLP